MSMITRCPECSTLFKVVPDQLRISDGWVRCGQCGHVFDGAANLQQGAGTEVVLPGPGAVVTEDRAEPVESLEHPAMQPLSTVLPDDGPNEPLPHGQTWAAMVDADPGLPQEPWAQALGPQVDEAAPELSELEGPAAPPGPEHENNPAHESSSQEVSFLRAARRKTFWRRPAVRWALALVGVALTLLLALQVAVQERDRLAGVAPATKPWLQTLCEGLGCTVEPLKSLETLTVESSSFNRVRGDAYRLQVTLKNTGRTELHWPAMELTLTDTRDAVVLRRVLLPADLGMTTPSLAAGAEWSGTLMVALSGVPRISGYRVLAFYP